MNPRATELSLLIPVILLVLAGLFLVTNGKLATHAAPPDAINVNTCDASTLARVLGVPRAVGGLLVKARESRRGHAFGSVYDLRHNKALAGFTLPSTGGRLIAREASQVTHSVLIGSIIYLLAFLLIHIILSKAAPSGDPIILP